MSNPLSAPPSQGKPSPDDLAGVPAARGEDDPKGAPCKQRSTADDLAGVPVLADGEEDVTVRPRRRS